MDSARLRVFSSSPWRSAVAPAVLSAWLTLLSFLGVWALHARIAPDTFGLTVLAAFVGFPQLWAFATRRFADAYAAHRGDDRPLCQPTSTTVMAFLGLVLLPMIVCCPIVMAAPGWTAPHLAVFLLLSGLGGAALLGWLYGRPPAPWTLTLGCDALTFDAGERSVILPLRDIRNVGSTRTNVYIQYTAAHRLVLPLDTRAHLRDDIVREVAASARAARESPPLSEPLRQQGRSLAEWRDALRAQNLGGSGYRSTPMTRETLLDALTHPAATPEERLGAALGLDALDPRERTHVRIAADGVAHPALREALYAVADGTLDDATARRATGA